MSELETDYEAIWVSERLSSSEHFRCLRDGDGYRLAGVTVLPRWDRPATIKYELLVDLGWNTRYFSMGVDYDGPVVTIEADPVQGTWCVDGVLKPELQGCTDLDLGWTPATNSLPIHRLDLQPGEVNSIRAAWLRFPELDLVPSDQSYRRHDTRHWTYRSSSFQAALVTDEHGFVQRYGDDLWRLVVSTTRSSR